MCYKAEQIGVAKCILDNEAGKIERTIREIIANPSNDLSELAMMYMELFDFQENKFPFNNIGYWVNHIATFGINHLV